nr:DUF724 domain-containing protein 3-like [Ziziphus jujuba var. spinosa]
MTCKKWGKRIVVEKEEWKHLRVGSKVEVFCVEDGFQNAWFSAVILRPPCSSSRSSSSSEKKRKRSSDSKAFIRYDHLVTCRDRKPLTEYVEVSYIRPLPPNGGPDEQEIELYDVVDAFHRDVWRTGVVVSVVGDKYYVEFKNPPDLLGLVRSQLRLHWDWIQGTWNRPQKQQKTTGSSLFNPGEAIEVNLDDELPCIAWTPAIFLGEIGPNYFLVQSENSKIEEEGPHKITVELHQIRPHPPQAERRFDVFEKMDAFDGLHWCVGVITKVLTGRRSIVNFMRGKRVKEFDQSELRPHLEWVNGRWDTKSMNVTYSPDFKSHYPHACSSTKTSTIATQNESPGTRMKNTEEETSFSNNGDSQKEQKIKEQEVGRLGKLPTVSHKYKGRQLMPKSEFLGTWTATLKSRVISPKSQSKNVECLATGSNSEALTVSHAEESSPLPNENNVGVSNEIQGKGEDKLSIANGQAAAVGKRHNGAGVIAVDCTTDKVELPITARVEVSGDQLNGAAVVEDCRPDKSELTVRVPGSEDVLKDGTALVFTTDCSTEEVIVAVDVSHMQLNGTVGVEDRRTDKSELTVGVPGCEDVLRDGTPLVPTTDCLTEQVMVAVDRISSSGVSDKQLNGPAGVEDCGTNKSELAVRIPDCLTEEVMVAVDGISSNDVSDNQPLSVHINEIHSIENADDSGTRFTGGNEQNNSLSLPFVKKFSIWQQIESMEVFRKLPQNPHFQPLVKSKEIYREGLAIGNMLAFVSFVETIAKLEIDSPREFFNDAIETLVEMEKMGFNVDTLRGRLSEMQLVQVKLRQLQDDSLGIKTKITESTYEKIKTNEEVGELLKEMKKLEEKKARLITKTVAISTDLDMLQSEDSVITEDILRMKQTFLVLRQF